MLLGKGLFVIIVLFLGFVLIPYGDLLILNLTDPPVGAMRQPGATNMKALRANSEKSMPKVNAITLAILAKKQALIEFG